MNFLKLLTKFLDDKNINLNSERVFLQKESSVEFLEEF